MHSISPKTPSENSFQLKLIFSIVLFAIVSRIAIPPFFGHIPNFSPLDAIALFCGTYFYKRIAAFVITLLSVWLGDIVINKMMLGHVVFFYPGCYWQYASYLLIAVVGMRLHQGVTLQRVAKACLASSMLFFMISNFGVWMSGALYPMTTDGLIACYLAAIPFFKNTLLSDFLFAAVLFGSFEFALKRDAAVKALN
jgi:hypothetical protein